jgi:transposase InsO family protein
MEQIARNLTDCQTGILTANRFLIIDRDALFSPRFKDILASSGIETVLTAYRAPNMNAFAERFVRSIKSECLNQMVFVGQASLDRAIAEFLAHYHDERSHQGIGNQIVSGAMPQRIGQIEVKERLGGLLNYYHRRAA